MMSEEEKEEEEEPNVDYEAIYKEERRLEHEKSKQIVKDFLQQVEENQFSDFPGPPDERSPAFYYIRHYIQDYESKEDFESKEGSETAKKFLDQVRKSWGYDVDCIPPRWIGSLLWPLHTALEWYRSVKAASDCVIKSINDEAMEMGKTFELVKINKAVMAGRGLFFLTLTINHVEASAEKFIRAMVAMPAPWDPTVMECKLIQSIPT